MEGQAPEGSFSRDNVERIEQHRKGRLGRRQAVITHKIDPRTAPTLIAGILVIAALVVLMLMSYAQMVMINDQVVSLKHELSALQDEQTKLASQYELAFDLQTIESDMIYSGEMRQPQSYQVYTLELAEPDHVQYYDDTSLRARLTNSIRGLGEAVSEYF